MYKSMWGGGGLRELSVDDGEFRHATVGADDDLFGILETWGECGMEGGWRGGGTGGAAAAAPMPSSAVGGAVLMGAETTAGVVVRRREGDEEGDHLRKRRKGSAIVVADAAAVGEDGAAKTSHITVERNRRKQMNENLGVLRALMPCFYVKRGDQASIIGGVVNYIKELQQVLHLLEAKKHRKVYAEQVLSPRPPPPPPPPPPPSTASPRMPPLSPRLAVPMSPRTPTPGSPYKPCAALPPHPAAAYIPLGMTQSSSSSHMQDISPRPYLPALDSFVPDVKVEFAGANLVLKTTSHRAPGQVLKIIAALESLSLEILHISISSLGDTMVHSFTVKIGIECEVSAEELVHEIRMTFL